MQYSQKGMLLLQHLSYHTLHVHVTSLHTRMKVHVHVKKRIITEANIVKSDFLKFY